MGNVVRPASAFGGGEDADIRPASEYDTEDGYNDSNGCGKCPACDLLYSGNGGYVGEVYAPDGTHYEFYYDSPPGEGPYFCPECWPAVDALTKQQTNHTLGEFS